MARRPASSRPTRSWRSSTPATCRLVGCSLWRKRVKDRDLAGIKARPHPWAQGDAWPPDKVLSPVQPGLLNEKSVAFLPPKVHLGHAKSSENPRLHQRRSWYQMKENGKMLSLHALTPQVKKRQRLS